MHTLVGDVRFLILDFFTLSPLNIIFEISSTEHLSLDFIIDPDFQQQQVLVSFHSFSLNLNYIPD